jgi:hypothetical protein
MTHFCTISILSWISDEGEDHSFIFIIVGFFLLRYGLRWFLGISAISRNQREYLDRISEQNALLDRQNQMLERHNDILDGIRKKYL